jgi:PAS domain S-box-containing protein
MSHPTRSIPPLAFRETGGQNWGKNGRCDRVSDNQLDQGYLNSLLEDDEVEMSVVFSDPSLPDNPMVFVSDEFEAQTGYTPAEALGRNCRFLQGPDTNPHAVEAIRQGLRAQTRFTIDILNYRKDGSAFVNRLRIRPIYDADGRLLFFAGAQNPV